MNPYAHLAPLLDLGVAKREFPCFTLSLVLSLLKKEDTGRG